jgi:phospholipase A1
VLQGVFWGHGDLWLAIKSHWQIYNNLSRPLEVNYEPELILNFPVKFNLGLKLEWWE